MATEVIWQIASSSIEVVEPTMVRTIDNSPTEPRGDMEDTDPDAPDETRAVQMGSEYLYILKERLVNAGWQVVSSSYRTNYVSTGGVKGFVAPRNALNDDPDTYFTTIEGDGWLPKYGPSGSAPIYSASFDSVENPSWSVIYPGYVPIGTAGQKRGLESGDYDFGASSAKIGRSWILLRAPDNFSELQERSKPQNRNYHIVIDYVHSSKPLWHVNNSAIFDTFKPSSTYNDYADEFGAYINIIILPNYNPGDGMTNIDNSGTSFTPDSYKRPSHAYEVGNVSKSTVTGMGSVYFKFIGAGKAAGQDQTASKHFLNAFYVPGPAIGGSETDNGGTIILGSIQGVSSFCIVLGSISDPIAPEIVHANDNNTSSYAGTRYFWFWSNLQRSTINKNRALSSTKNVDLSNSIFDSTEDSVSMFTYTRYRPDIPTGVKYISTAVNTCALAFYSKTSATKKGTQVLLSTIPFAKTTSEYTYMEWPLPLISIDGNSANFKYHGRMMDIKMGHSFAPDGILAKEEETSTNFDRFSFSGIWFPYNSPDALVF